MCMVHQGQFLVESQTKTVVLCSQVQLHSSIWCYTAPKEAHIPAIDSQIKMPFCFFLTSFSAMAFMWTKSNTRFKQWKREVPPNV